MKKFIYTVETKKGNVSNLTFAMYYVKYNEPYYLGKTSESSASYKGNLSTVCEWLVDNKYLPKTALKDGYVNHKNLNESFKIIEL